MPYVTTVAEDYAVQVGGNIILPSNSITDYTIKQKIILNADKSIKISGVKLSQFNTHVPAGRLSTYYAGNSILLFSKKIGIHNSFMSTAEKIQIGNAKTEILDIAIDSNTDWINNPYPNQFPKISSGVFTVSP